MQKTHHQKEINFETQNYNEMMLLRSLEVAVTKESRAHAQNKKATWPRGTTLESKPNGLGFESHFQDIRLRKGNLLIVSRRAGLWQQSENAEEVLQHDTRPCQDCC
eukprot:Selendium_serpulae@DN5835_c0_g2_i1.p1